MSNFEFNPNLTPRQVIQAGGFGGSYFGIAIDQDTEYDYSQLFNYHFKDLDTNLYLRKTYKPGINKFKVRSGMSYEYWKEMGWMHERDPYGWFEWWCKYEMGMRGEDDHRQIKRWQDFCGTAGRWRNAIYNKIYKTEDWDISPKIQQSLLHWGYRVNDDDYLLWCRLNNRETYSQEEWCEYGGIPSPLAYQ